jgi:hypothetical protein
MLEFYIYIYTHTHIYIISTPSFITQVLLDIKAQIDFQYNSR